MMFCVPHAGGNNQQGPSEQTTTQGGTLQANDTTQTQPQGLQPNVDVFGAQPFTKGSVTTPPVEQPPVAPLLLLGDNDDDFKSIRDTTPTEGSAEAAVDLNLQFSNPIRQLDEFGAAPFSPRRTSHSSSDQDNESREFNYENSTTRTDEEHIHRGLLEHVNSSDEESDDDSYHPDNDSLNGNIITVDDQDFSDAELAGLNLGDHTPPAVGVAVGVLIDTGPEPDPFGHTPFVAPGPVKSSLNQRTEPLSSCTLTPPISPPTQAETDPFGEAPFNPPKVTRKGSRTSSESSDVFAKAPFPAASKKRPESQPAQTGGHKAKSQRSAATQQSVGNPTPPISPTEMDMFGAKPFTEVPVAGAKTEQPDLFGAVPFEAVATEINKDTNVQSHLKLKQETGKVN